MLTTAAGVSRRPDKPAPDLRWMRSEEWKLVERILASRHFVKGPTLSAFLRYVCERSLSDRTGEITEHRIGVQVFGRPVTYSPSEDNIVRNYARQLRRRLADFFDDEGRDEPMRLVIPRGGYIPQFLPVASGSALVHEPAWAPRPIAPAAAPAHRILRLRWLAVVALVIFVTVMVTFAASSSWRGPFLRSLEPPATHPDLWNALFTTRADTLLVPADAGLGVLQNISGQRVSLGDYVAGRYDSLALPGMDPHAAHDLRVQQYTTKIDLDIAARIARLPEVVPDRFALRFARDLRMDDLKRGNAILIGSPYSNPWTEVFEPQLKFRFVYRPDLHRSWIANTQPQANEAREYENGWESATRTTYATLSLVPNLRGDGRVLLIQGLDVAGTEAAAEFALQPGRLEPILAQCRRRDGSLAPFEVLLRTSSIGSEAPRADVIASRIAHTPADAH